LFITRYKCLGRADFCSPRFDFQKPKPAPAKKELFSRPEALEQPFSSPEVLPALRELLKRDRVEETEVIRVLQDAAPRGTRAPASLDATPERSLQLLLDRWEVVRELVESERSEEAAR
jgi:hypothetical protein